MADDAGIQRRVVLAGGTMTDTEQLIAWPPDKGRASQAVMPLHILATACAEDSPSTR